MLMSALPADVLRFAMRHGISQYLTRAAELVTESIPDVQQVDSWVECDPENGDEWVQLEVTTTAGSDAVYEGHTAYTRKWAAAVPVPAMKRICISFNMI